MRLPSALAAWGLKTLVKAAEKAATVTQHSSLFPSSTRSISDYIHDDLKHPIAKAAVIQKLKSTLHHRKTHQWLHLSSNEDEEIFPSGHSWYYIKIPYFFQRI